ncbi:hypothetical protein [Deinococcus sp.]|uniref:hypothetical protein n=1 Tax=Deinococcus sp. TaxID=47478 RepID=UPI0025C6C4AE|nr:hypothetical protein [Deinococcus sp.]
MRDWYAGLPEDTKRGITKNPLIMFSASDGKTYSNSAEAVVRSGKMMQEGNNAFVRFSDGSPDQGYVKTNVSPNGISALDYTCNTTDGPYYRSWSLTGYSGIYSVMNIQSASLPQINGKDVAAYSYLGGLVQGQSDVDAGIVYLNGTLRVFKTDVKGYDDTYARDLKLNTNYPARLTVSGSGTYVLRVDRPDTGGSAVLVNVMAAGANFTGTNMYLKRMASIASKGLAGYTGSTKFQAKSVTAHTESKLAKYVNGNYSYQDWNTASINTGGCRWPNSTIVQITSGGATSNNFTADVTAQQGKLLRI